RWQTGLQDLEVRDSKGFFRGLDRVSDRLSQRLGGTAQLCSGLQVAILDGECRETVHRVRDRHLVPKLEREIRGLGKMLFRVEVIAAAKACGAKIVEGIADRALVVQLAEQRKGFFEQRTCASEVFLGAGEVTEKGETDGNAKRIFQLAA